jgi:DNA-binding transcriptional MerR regulator
VTSAAIPNRPLFRAQEVCELAEVQAYVLRSWEAEFPDLGVAKTPGGPRVYRRPDVERVLRIKQLVFVDGLTLAGARRQLSEEGLAVAASGAETIADSDVAALVDEATRQELLNVRRGLSWILGVLSGNGVTPEDFVLTSERRASGATVPHARKAVSTASSKNRHAKPARPARKPVGAKKR